VTRPLLIAALVVVLDHVSKWLVIDRIPLHAGVDVIPGLFRLTHLENTGAAFSLFADAPGPWVNRILIVFSAVAAVVVAVLLGRSRSVFNLSTVSLALVLGGALGNLWDRLLHGRVTDFLDVFIGTHHWPPFNVADSAVVVGTLMLAGKVFLAPPEENAAG
jgi:signal peptidase II